MSTKNKFKLKDSIMIRYGADLKCILMDLNTNYDLILELDGPATIFIKGIQENKPFDQIFNELNNVFEIKDKKTIKKDFESLIEDLTNRKILIVE